MHRIIVVALILVISLKKFFFAIFFCCFWVKNFDPPTLPKNKKHGQVEQN